MRSEAQYVWDIVEATEAIGRFLAGKTEIAFRDDEILRSAVHAKLIIIGEAVSRLTPELTAKYPSIPWHEIRGFRNVVVHGYFKIDWDIIWNAANSDVRALNTVSSEMLENEFPQFRPENF